MTDNKFDIAGPVSIVSTGKKEVKQEAFEKVVDSLSNNPDAVGQTLDDIYDRFSKLIYLIDASGSMGEGMKSEPDGPIQYDWNESILDEARELLLERIDDGDSILDPTSGVDLTPAKVKKLTSDELKAVILDSGLEDDLGLQEIPTGPKPTAPGKKRSKMMAVKDAARDFVRARFKKWPDAKVFLFSFEMHPTMLSGGSSEADVIKGIDSLPNDGGGGTDIFTAVARAVEHCKKRAKEVGAHHIVLVSDGMDGGAVGCRGLLPDMKEIGIVFDFIFIQGSLEIDPRDPVIKVLRELCEATGGEFTTVKTEQDFVQKFLAASNRKCLPPAPAQIKGGK